MLSACKKEKNSETVLYDYIGFYDKNFLEPDIQALLSDEGKSYAERWAIVRRLTEDILNQYGIPTGNITHIYVFGGNSPGFAVASLDKKQAEDLSADDRIRSLEKDGNAITIQ